MGWISVHKQLPKTSEVVMIYTPKLVRIGYLLDNRWYYYQNLGEMDAQCWADVTHWMPLPNPPED